MKKIMFNEELAKHIDFNNLTMEECKSLRFGRWDKENGHDVIVHAFSLRECKKHIDNLLTK